MAEQNLIDRLDSAIDAILAGRREGLAAADPDLAMLIVLAGDLRDLPDPDFKRRLKTELFPQAKENAMPSSTAPTELQTLIPYLVVRGADRLIDFMKVRRITALFTSLTMDEGQPEETDAGISSFMDTWLVLQNVEANGERNRRLSVLKSRGMAHSNQVREFVLTNHGLKVLDVVRHRGRVLIGSERSDHDAPRRANGARAHPKR